MTAHMNKTKENNDFIVYRNNDFDFYSHETGKVAVCAMMRGSGVIAEILGRLKL